MVAITKTELIKLLNLYNLSADKKLGQNFLIDENVVKKIVNLADVVGKDVIEIGSGPGTLTVFLSRIANSVYAVEIDKKILNVLLEVTKELQNVNIINEDILQFDFHNLKKDKLIIVGNLPYYITSQILFKIFENRKLIDSFTIMIQKEVAQRILAKPNTKEYGILTVSFNFYCDYVDQFMVSKNVFYPKPDVDSAVIKAKFKDNIPDIDEALFFSIVHACFNTRRKTILNALSINLDIEKDKIERILDKANIDPNLRAENLTVENYLTLYYTVVKNMK
ncbi:16S rRNA (adenine(1518)-N(6)/adenine(1519)-N(6))-dimethyltransferase RsmA [Caldicellulosiruptoraceae bacterium PP1]